MSSAAPKFIDEIVSKHLDISVVRLVRDIEAEDFDGKSQIYQAGTRGTVVHVHRTGRDYLVEVYEPTHGLVSATDDDLVAE